MKPLVVIPARGGSKGVPRKNIKKLSGKPLIYYTLDTAREVFEDDIICVSTDDDEIKQAVEETGLKVPFLRPSKLATDTVGSREVLLHALKYFKEQIGYDADTVILLQPTSPFRKSIHIEEALSLYDDEVEMVVSVKEAEANPYYILFEENEKGFLEQSKSGDYTRRQDCPRVWQYNGAIYLIDISILKKKEINQFKMIRKYVMDEHSSIDIDTKLDWKFAEFLLNESK